MEGEMTQRGMSAEEASAQLAEAISDLKPQGAELTLIPIGDYEWTEDYSFLRTLTCKNHPTARYLTKNPWWRGIHVIKLPEGDIPRSETGECQCPLKDLAVVVEETEKGETDGQQSH